MMIFYTPPGIEEMIKLDGKVIESPSEVIRSDNQQEVACPQLSAGYFVTASSRHIAIAHIGLSKYHSHALWQFLAKNL